MLKLMKKSEVQDYNLRCPSIPSCQRSHCNDRNYIFKRMKSKLYWKTKPHFEEFYENRKWIEVMEKSEKRESQLEKPGTSLIFPRGA